MAATSIVINDLIDNRYRSYHLSLIILLIWKRLRAVYVIFYLYLLKDWRNDSVQRLPWILCECSNTFKHKHTPHIRARMYLLTYMYTHSNRCFSRKITKQNRQIPILFTVKKKFRIVRWRKKNRRPSYSQF